MAASQPAHPQSALSDPAYYTTGSMAGEAVAWWYRIVEASSSKSDYMPELCSKT